MRRAAALGVTLVALASCSEGTHDAGGSATPTTEATVHLAVENGRDCELITTIAALALSVSNLVVAQEESIAAQSAEVDALARSGSIDSPTARLAYSRIEAQRSDVAAARTALSTAVDNAKKLSTAEGC